MREKLFGWLLLATATCGGAEQNSSAPAAPARDALSRMAAALEVIHKHYIEPRRLAEPPHASAALRAYVESIDPEARLLAPGELPAVHAQTMKTPPPLKFLGNGIAYLRVPQFSVAGVERLRNELLHAEAEQARALILDIRDNPGGDFPATVMATQMFLPATAEVVTLAYPNNPGVVFSSEKGEKFNAPLVLLINGGTAAEAEILAAALRDHKRAQLVGSKTAGRGRLISQFALPDGFSLLLPAAHYIPPSKKSFDRTGLTSDVSIVMAAEAERRLAATGFGLFDWINDKQAVLAADLPLAKALELLSK